MKRKKLLQRAEDHIFSTGLNDGAARLGLANMKYGLAKIHRVQETLGFEPNATFVASPDLTVTRNVNRWKSGMGYGGKLTWGDGHQELVVLDVKPNICGMLVGGLDSLPTVDVLFERLQALENGTTNIDGILIKWDFGISNHFISLFRVHPMGKETLPEFVFILHCSGGELRGETLLGDGLYWDKSGVLMGKAEVIETPFGPLRILTGRDAQAYYDFHCRAEEFIKQRRLLAAERLFGDYTLINNEAHQGLLNKNEMLLGSYHVQADSIYPMTLRADLPAYLLRGKPNLADATIERLGFGERARQNGVYERLTSANIVPHGGGYHFPQIQDVLAVFERNGKRHFEISLNYGTRQYITHTRDMPYTYRGQEVVERTVDLGMGELVARLNPVFGLKL